MKEGVERVGASHKQRSWSTARYRRAEQDIKHEYSEVDQQRPRSECRELPIANSSVLDAIATLELWTVSAGRKPPARPASMRPVAPFRAREYPLLSFAGRTNCLGNRSLRMSYCV